MNQSYISRFLHSKLLWFFIVIDIGLIIATIIVATINQTKTAIISFNIIPSDVTIKLNGDEGYNSNGTYQVHPGDYNIEISHDELASKTFNVHLQKGTNTLLTTYLVQDNGSLDFYKKKGNRQSFEELYKIISRQNTTNISDESSNQENTTVSHADHIISINDSTSAQNPVTTEDMQQLYADALTLQSLPIKATNYIDTPDGRHLDYDVTIRTSNSSECQTWLCIEALMVGTDDHNLIQDLLKRERFNMEDYEIIYKVY